MTWDTCRPAHMRDAQEPVGAWMEIESENIIALFWATHRQLQAIKTAAAQGGMLANWED